MISLIVNLVLENDIFLPSFPMMNFMKFYGNKSLLALIDSWIHSDENTTPFENSFLISGAHSLLIELLTTGQI